MRSEKIALIISIIYLSFVTFLAYISVKNTESDLVLRRWKFNGKAVEIPFHLYTDSPTVVVLETVFEFDSKKAYLILPHIHTQAIEVYLNGERIFSLGHEKAYYDFDSVSLSVPLDLREGENELAIELTALLDLHIDWSPYIVGKPDYRVALSNFLFSFVNLIAVGSLLMGFVYDTILTLIRRRMYYFTFGLATLFTALYLINYTFNFIAVDEGGYVIWTKFLVSVVYLFLPFIAVSFDLVNEGRVRIKSWILIVIGFLLAFLSYFDSPYRYVEKTAIYFPIVAFFGLIESRKSKFWEFKVGSLIVFLTVIQHFFYVIHLSPFPSLIGHGVLNTLVMFTLFLTTEFTSIERELMKTKKDLFTDPLTGAFNRRILDILEVSSSDVVIFFDLDDFKKVNDEKGHEYGDEVLRRFVSTVRKIVRKEDVIVRYGGDEFILVLKNCDIEKARELAKMVKDSMMNETGVSVSYGISKITDRFREAISKADKLMYEMKKFKLSRAS